MHHIPGSELAEAVVELHSFAQIKGPFFQVRAGLPLFRQARSELPGLGINVEQRLYKRVVLQVLGTSDGPETVALSKAGGAKNDTLHFGFCSQYEGGWRDRQRGGERHQE